MSRWEKTVECRECGNEYIIHPHSSVCPECGWDKSEANKEKAKQLKSLVDSVYSIIDEHGMEVTMKRKYGSWFQLRVDMGEKLTGDEGFVTNTDDSMALQRAIEQETGARVEVLHTTNGTSKNQPSDAPKHMSDSEFALNIHPA